MRFPGNFYAIPAIWAWGGQMLAWCPKCAQKHALEN